MRRKISPKFHVKNGAINGTFHANFTLLGRSAGKERKHKSATERTKNPAILKLLPKAPFRTKSATALQSAVFCDRRDFALSVRVAMPTEVCCEIFG